MLCAGFLATVFDVFRSNQVSVDVVATSEVSISLSLDPKKCWHDGEVGGPGAGRGWEGLRAGGLGSAVTPGRAKSRPAVSVPSK